ncbi:hypothetical protein L1887_35572 [Cichorium endivia]|nr:hypothetical protein L1887_35572 [Cichorium endivia]
MQGLIRKSYLSDIQNRVAMKRTLQRKENIAQAGRHIVKPSKVKKGTKRQKGPSQKASEVLNQQLSASEPFIETKKEEKKLELKSGEVVDLDPSTKIKLQLFPVNEVTRIGLEKDGLNPYLELTLRARKKISSVINHIHTKWGGSSIAIGELMLLPYESHLKHSFINTKITAGDVYTALQNPSVFRLSYGWFSNQEPQKVPTKEIETKEEKKLLETTDEKVKIGQSQTHEQSIPPWDDNMTNLSIGGLLSEPSLQGKQQTQIKWEDDITNLSIGGLLSEASMQAKINKLDPKSFISDSFDAILSSQIKNDPQVSILDAEETCHAFSFRKFSSSNKNVRVSVKSSQDLNSNSFKFPHLLEVEKHAEDASVTESKTELFPRPQQQYNEDSRSLGLRGLSWNESLGPFDLGNSLPWKIW